MQKKKAETTGAKKIDIPMMISKTDFLSREN